MTDTFHSLCVAGTMDWFASIFDLYPEPVVESPPIARDTLAIVLSFGASAPGALILRVSEATFTAVVQRYTGGPPDASMASAAAAPLNRVLASNVKARLESAAGGEVVAAPPWVLQPESALLDFPGCAPLEESAFSTPLGGFVLATAESQGNSHG